MPNTPVDNVGNAIGQGVRSFADDIVKNPTSVLGKTADEIAEIFTKEGYKAIVESARSGGTRILIEGHQINSIRISEEGGRHILGSIRVSGNNVRTKIIFGSRKSCKGNIKEEAAARTTIIFIDQ
ncbi:MAG: hypothetical protein Pars93KO_26810 [Parasphingorhabdus sp.]